jgi:hypothetical protein
MASRNPFEVTKAVDFTDEQIAATWVDLPGGGFASLADPRSPMPIFLVGGKGGGRTHLLRYFSFSLQKIRHGQDIAAGVKSDGYVGMYFRCAGLNSSRFSGKGQSADTWLAVFAYYTELWLGLLTLDLLDEFLRVAPLAATDQEVAELAGAVAGLFDKPVGNFDSTDLDLGTIRAAFRTRQRDLDVAINNAALTGALEVSIGASPGRLVFGIPKAVRDHLGAFSGVSFAYLIDEFENLTLDQQRYVNTLVREKELPVNFVIGSRLFGLRTQKTLAASEENRRGSEFDLVVLEEEYRAQSHKYSQFCEQIVRRRLSDAPAWSDARKVEDLFDSPGGERSVTLEQRADQAVASARRGQDRPWIQRLTQQLVGAGFEVDVSEIVGRVEVRGSALHEKFAILLLYRAWADGEDLRLASLRLRDEVRELEHSSEAKSRVQTSYNHYKQDLYAQLRRDLRLPQEYAGFTDFVRMSGFLPRNLLVVLKQIARWSNFQGEQPFAGGRISVRAQIEGVREASSWFLSDAKGLGEIGEETQFAIRKLASLFREARFSDKPVEVSCSAFSADRQQMSVRALACLDDAVSHSLLLEVPIGRKDKNSHLLQYKYQLNPMLAPQFDLSLALRGSMGLSGSDLNAIFDVSLDTSYEGLQRKIVGRMQAPFGIAKARVDGNTQTSLDLA